MLSNLYLGEVLLLKESNDESKLAKARYLVTHNSNGFILTLTAIILIVRSIPVDVTNVLGCFNNGNDLILICFIFNWFIKGRNCVIS